ncbi:amidohydrolase family protein [Bradymonas sediminis]|uniref:2-amino-3-carboxymuconate-6-semialdehyde decarboxylase n=1 Tax=Bradymonas sediminis TaxID=1548548 RepID=A0A2Z4FMT0_9DELT|nr:amidohydrolase family protein [Bradymonas sediminis]AWV90291.1 amidohydrolase [Bradymonas sediminis]TDP75738.1 aminocarboxymuconate-semialdehyde decarboxylase [Bradymonas sediminis]
MKIDIHAHILPRDWPDLRERYGYGGFIRLEHTGTGCAKMMKGQTFFREVHPNLWDPAVRVEECDAQGVDVQVLSTVPVMFSYWAKPADTHDLSKILNDHIADCIARFPKRFMGLGTVPMQAPRRAAQELERCINDLGLVGVQIGTHVENQNLDDPIFDPFWQAANDLGAAIFVHPWDMMGFDDLPRHWLPWLVSMPAESSRAICSLMMGGVIEKYPRIRFAFAHGGGSFAATLGRIDHGFKMRPDLCQTQTSTPPSELARRIYIDSLVHDPRALEFVVDIFGEERIALGTDYPFPLGELAPGQLIESVDFLSAAARERMLSGTALEWANRARADYETDASRAHSVRITRSCCGPVTHHD